MQTSSTVYTFGQDMPPAGQPSTLGLYLSAPQQSISMDLTELMSSTPQPQDHQPSSVMDTETSFDSSLGNPMQGVTPTVPTATSEAQAMPMIWPSPAPSLESLQATLQAQQYQLLHLEQRAMHAETLSLEVNTLKGNLQQL